VEIDHVLVPVDDLGDAARALERRHGLASVPGGAHEAWGTANRIVPLGDAYLELVTVVDRAKAAATTFGRWIAAAPAGRPAGWVVRTRDLDAVAHRLGLARREGSRLAADGRTLRWRTAGMEAAAAERCLPFFIEWADGTDPPGRTRVDHPAGTVRLERLVVEGDVDRIRAWLGTDVDAVEVRAGASRIGHVTLAGSRGPIVLDGADAP
jgi:Glyoxalase-like domain